MISLIQSCSACWLYEQIGFARRSAAAPLVQLAARLDARHRPACTLEHRSVAYEKHPFFCSSVPEILQHSSAKRNSLTDRSVREAREVAV